MSNENEPIENQNSESSTNKKEETISEDVHSTTEGSEQSNSASTSEGDSLESSNDKNANAMLEQTEETNKDETATPEEPTATDAGSHEKEEAVEPQDEENDNHEDEGVDYSSMSIEELLTHANSVASDEGNLQKADRKMNAIREGINTFNQQQKEEQKTAFMQQEGANEIDFKYQQPKEVEEFYGLYKQVKENRKKHYENLTKEREDNLNKKRKIVEEVKNIIDIAEQKGSLAKVKELQKQWKAIGSVPKADADDLYKTYNALLDLFYDNKSIEYDLKELDRKKNLTSKFALCDRAEELLGNENINEAIKSLNLLHEEFKAIGPVPKEEQEDLWNRFKKASDELYTRKRAAAEEFKKQLSDNMKTKQELCLEVEPFLSFESDRIKEWNAKTKELLAIQEKWEKVGPLPREVAKDINKQFWGNFKQFFANKSKFFDTLEAQRADNLKQKQALVEQAETLKESTDWVETAEKLKALQQDWRKIGPVPEAHRDSVYASFKAACDEFFNRKRNRRAEQDKEFVENLKQKLAICDELGKLASAKKPTLEKFDESFKTYFEIGFVPRKDINSVLEKMLAAIDKFFDSFDGLEEDELEKKKMSYKGEVLKSVPNASKKLEKQEMAIRSKIQSKENDIALWQNNLQFFANSKTADKLKDEFNGKIEKAQKEISALKDQLKILRSIGDNS